MNKLKLSAKRTGTSSVKISRLHRPAHERKTLIIEISSKNSLHSP